MMKGALFFLAFATTALAQLPEQTPTPPIDPKIDFKVSVVGKRNEFHIGEIIPIELFFSSRTRKRYEINEAQYDRSGRMHYENFVVTPADGAEDPLAEYFRPDSAHIGGGITGFNFLEPKPWTIQLNLNEWIRFTKPGEYRLKVSSRRVKKIDSSGPYGKTPVTAISNEIVLKIIPRDPDWEKRAVDEATAILMSPSALHEDVRGNSAVSHAFETLRFLGTAEATRALVNQLGRKASDVFGGTCHFGIVYSPERAVAREALEQALAEPDRPIDLTFLDTLIEVEQGDIKDEVAARKDEQKVLQDVARVLPGKCGEALLVSLYSLLDHFWIRGGKDLLPKDTVDRLVEQLIAVFDRLTMEQQASLLSNRWENIKSPALLPLLKRYSQQNFSDVSPAEYAYAIGIPGVALRRWFELDPASARPAIIKEISQPKPRFDMQELGMLPDQTLPEVEQLLIDHLRGNRDFQNASKLASLIARYATRAILPQVIRELDANIGKWACEIQTPLLGYVLRLDPGAARPRIEKALAVQRKNSTPCNVLCGIALIHYDPLLEELAIRALDNRSDDGDAIGLLSGFGSAAAEEVLWRHYGKWCQRWAGREGQLNSQAVSRDPGTTSDLDVGRSFVREIVEGKGWLTDESKLRRLAAMSKVPTIQFELELYLERWRQPLTVTIFCTLEFQGAVAHYDFRSLDALKEKLTQFAPGTKFVLSLPFDKSDPSCVGDLRAFLASRGFTAIESKDDKGN